MSLFHRHRWSEVGRTYTPPNPTLARVKGTTAGEAERAFNGWTNVELRCEECGVVRFVSVAGKAERPCD